MAGRNKQPLSVIQGKGRSKHLTKDEIARRQEQENMLNGFDDNIVAPTYLTASQKKEFDKLASELVRLNIFSNLDVDTLARYIDSRDEHIRLGKTIKKLKPTIAIEDDDGNTQLVANEAYLKLRRTRNLLFNECRSVASDLGLSITSRLKLVIPKKDDDTPKSEAEKRFSGRL